MVRTAYRRFVLPTPWPSDESLPSDVGRSSVNPGAGEHHAL